MKLEPGITLLEEVPGTGSVARKGDRVTYNLRLFLNRGDEVALDALQKTHISRAQIRREDGREVIDRVVTLGKREVVPAVEYALTGMKVGGYRKVRASPHLAYRQQGIPGLIPENAVLVVELWLRAIQPAPAPAGGDELPVVDSGPNNPHFATVETWHAALAMLTFRPLEPGHTAGFSLESLRIHIRDHNQRDLVIGDRTLEAHYGAFVLSQARKGAEEAQRLALDVSYGTESRKDLMAGHEVRVYELGPNPEPDDIDGRPPAVVTWSDADMFYLVASDELSADALIRIAESLY